MNRVTSACRILLGLIFLGAGINGYLVLVGLQPIFPTSPKAMELLGSGYLLAMEKTVEVVAGALLVTRRFVPLALAMLLPPVVNILAFHVFVDHALLPLAIVVTVLEVYLLWVEREHFRGLLVSR
jgi:uncharacterized membrane protein YphA (DoxX/SURF4 family)